MYYTLHTIMGIEKMETNENTNKGRTSEYQLHALDKNVLAVAKLNYFNGELMDWASYVGGVPGIDHDQEYLEVARLGSKSRINEAKAYFPDLDIQKYRE